VNESLTKCDSNIIFSCHDHEFVQTVANRIIEILPNGTIIDVEKSFDDYLGLN
jgi:ATPase subunit of ABC transporter with duplicated ATPase domains